MSNATPNNLFILTAALTIAIGSSVAGTNAALAGETPDCKPAATEAGEPLVTAYDRDNDGVTDTCIRYEYDSDGQLVVKTMDRHNDGTLDRRTEYTYDGLGNLLTRAVDRGVDGDTDTLETYQYDDQGQLLAKLVDVGNDGRIERTTTYTWNQYGNLVHEELDGNGDKLADRVQAYRYNRDGQLVQKTVDHGGDGTIERLVEFQPEPSPAAIASRVTDSLLAGAGVKRSDFDLDLFIIAQLQRVLSTDAELAAAAPVETALGITN